MRIGIVVNPDAGLAVSYTHLRAHETDSYLVCRLLLEKRVFYIRWCAVVVWAGAGRGGWFFNDTATTEIYT